MSIDAIGAGIVAVIYIAALVMIYRAGKPVICPRCGYEDNVKDGYGTHCRNCKYQLSKY